MGRSPEHGASMHTVVTTAALGQRPLALATCVAGAPSTAMTRLT
jgi:hypothetical protein